MTDALRTFEGSCHCGALGFRLQTALAPGAWSVRACGCQFCRAHAALTTSDPCGRLRFQVQKLEVLQRYRFGLRTADFLLCRRCGVYLGAQIETAQGAFGIVNLLAMQPTPADLARATGADYDAEDVNERIARRMRRWTPLDKIV